MNAANSASVTVVPVGLFGLHTKMSFVRSVTAAARADRSTRWSAVSGTGTGVAPAIWAKMG